MSKTIKGMNPSLVWLSDLLSMFSSETITIPTNYRDKVLKTKKLLEDDTSGLVNCILDFGINSALVPFYIKSDNENLEKFLNNWLVNINAEMRGKIPTGLDSLSKQYYMERWKGSSNLLLRTFWNTRDGVELPTTLFFLAGEDIKVKSKKKESRAIVLGEEEYFIRVDNIEEHDISLPKDKTEKIYVQRPYEAWSNFTSVPFIIRRGLFRNLSFLKLMSQKGEHIVGKALEYLFLIKKGTKEMAMSNNPDFVYSSDDLKKVSDDLANLLRDKKNQDGPPTYSTNFDTEMSHLIPEYEKAVSQALFEPIERKIMAGLGLVDVLQGMGATRKESTINPKPFMSEVVQGSDDWKAMLNDIVQDIKLANKEAHPKWMKATIEITSSPIKEFLTEKDKTYLRSLYDRGRYSSRSLIEVTTESSYKEELKRITSEKDNKEDKKLFPPVTQNQEKDIEPIAAPAKPIIKKEEVPEDKKNIEKKNFKMAKWEELTLGSGLSMRCLLCEYEDDLSVFLDNLVYSDFYDKTVSVCPGCGQELLEEDAEFVVIETSKIIEKTNKILKEVDVNIEKLKEETSKEFEQAPYTKKNFPSQIKNLPAGARSIWINTFNSVLKETNNEDQARQAAWKNVKLRYTEVKDKWTRKTKAEFTNSAQELDLGELIELRKLEIFNKQHKLLDMIIKETENENIESE